MDGKFEQFALTELRRLVADIENGAKPANPHLSTAAMRILREQFGRMNSFMPAYNRC